MTRHATSGNLRLQNAGNQGVGIRQWESYVEQARAIGGGSGGHDGSGSSSSSRSNSVKDSEFKTMVRGGVPSQFRGEVWKQLVEHKVEFEKKSCDAGFEVFAFYFILCQLYRDM